MDAIEAIKARHSVRDFKTDPVPKETIMKIMEAAEYSPSGGNGQPWEVFIAAGATMERIRAAFQAPSAGGPGGPGPGKPSGGPPGPAFIMERMSVITAERLKLLGFEPNDPEGRKAMMVFGSQLYNAPVMAIICMDKSLSSNLDLGMFIQSICIAAQNFGVDTMIASGFVSKQDVLRKELGIPDSMTIVTGIGLGYANPYSIINTYRSPRRPVDEVVRYKD